MDSEEKFIHRKVDIFVTTLSDRPSSFLVDIQLFLVFNSFIKVTHLLWNVFFLKAV